MSVTPTPRIFVVDDEEAICVSMAAILRLSGFRVTSFTNPLQSLASAFAGQPDLLISDVMMPGLSGVDLATQIQQVCPDCAILLVSGVAGIASQILDQEVLGHPFDLLAKPVQPPVLIEAIRRKLTRCASPTRPDGKHDAAFIGGACHRE